MDSIAFKAMSRNCYAATVAIAPRYSNVYIRLIDLYRELWEIDGVMEDLMDKRVCFGLRWFEMRPIYIH